MLLVRCPFGGHLSADPGNGTRLPLYEPHPDLQQDLTVTLAVTALSGAKIPVPRRQPGDAAAIREAGAAILTACQSALTRLQNGGPLPDHTAAAAYFGSITLTGSRQSTCKANDHPIWTGRRRARHGHGPVIRMTTRPASAAAVPHHDRSGRHDAGGGATPPPSRTPLCGTSPTPAPS